MTNHVPEWADPQLSVDLLGICAGGESQEVEFMREFPTNSNELAREIAAFASSNSGQILVGVDDDGTVCGIPKGHDSSVRDDLQKRLAGICRGPVKPAVTPTARFSVASDGSVVLIVGVPKGSEPIYYSNGKPYVRHLTDSRPAEPHEVVDAVRSTFRVELSEGPQDAEQEVGRVLCATVRTLLIAATEADSRLVNPWLDLWRAEFADGAAKLREIAASHVAEDMGVTSAIQDAADRLDAVARFRMTLGCGPEFRPLVIASRDVLKKLLHEVEALCRAPRLSGDDLQRLTEPVIRSLDDLVRRAPTIVEEGRVGELQEAAAREARRLLDVAYMPVEGVAEETLENLRNTAHALRLVETMTIHMDGGASMNRVVDEVSERRNQIAELLRSL